MITGCCLSAIERDLRVMSHTCIEFASVIKMIASKPERGLAPISLSCCIALAGSHIPFRDVAIEAAHGVACRVVALLVVLCVAISPCRLWRGDFASPSWLACMLCSCAQLATDVSSFMSHKCLKHKCSTKNLTYTRNNRTVA